MKCSLIVCTYNWPDALLLVLNSIELQSELPDEIVIADDGSGKSTSKVIDLFSKKTTVPVIHSWQTDYGCRIPHSRNRAIAKSSYEYTIVIDGDTILHKNFIKDHKRYAKHGVYIQGSRVLLQPEFTLQVFENSSFKKPSFFLKQAKNKLNMIYFPFFSFLMSFIKTKNLNRIRGCNFSLYKKDILKVNGFNEEIKTWGREDSEFVQRLFNSGIYKQHLKFSGIQYHLYHKEGTHNSTNDNILNETINNKLVSCSLGINRYL
jgi:glycosyltransferase involved in cell wall biosynthesis